jgi:hypothetical protein
MTKKINTIQELKINKILKKLLPQYNLNFSNDKIINVNNGKSYDCDNLSELINEYKKQIKLLNDVGIIDNDYLYYIEDIFKSHINEIKEKIR